MILAALMLDSIKAVKRWSMQGMRISPVAALQN